MSLPPYAADLVVPIAWGVVGLLLAALVYALLRGHRGPTVATDTAADSAGPLADPATPEEAAAAPIPPATPPATPPAATPAPAGAWDQGQPAPEPVAPTVSSDASPLLAVTGSPEPTPDVREMRVLRRQVDVLTRTLAEWDLVRLAEAPEPPATSPAEVAAPPATPPAHLGPVPRPSLPGAAYLDLSRRLAERGDLDGAVLAQWACDLEVLRGPLAGHEGDLATAVAAVRGDDPVDVLRGCRETALALVAVAGPVRTLLAPLDHLVDAAGADPDARVRTAGFPVELIELAPEADRPALSALVAGQQS